MGGDKGTFAIVTLGCKAGQSDGEALAAELAAGGLRPASRSEAGLVVVNGCAVTAAAEGKGRGELARARRENPRATLAVAGCLARLRGERLAAERAADLVWPGPAGWPARVGGGSAPPPLRRSRPLLKVQDGCDRSCAYCVVPALRGAPRSLPAARVVGSLADLAGAGAAEVALAGVHLGLWGLDLDPPSSLEDLLGAILAARLSARVRLSSLEPGEVSDRLLRLVAGSEGRLCPHLHLPLQSGSERVLRAMGRAGGAAAFAHAVERARRAIPGVGIGADLIAGFPGETEEDFARTLLLVERWEVPFIHAFPFSPRPGTAAARMPDDIPPEVKRERVRRLREAGAAARARFQGRFAGTALEVVLEGGRSGGRRKARAGNYLPVLVAGGEGIARGAAARARVTGAEGEALLAEVEA